MDPFIQPDLIEPIFFWVSRARKTQQNGDNDDPRKCRQDFQFIFFQTGMLIIIIISEDISSGCQSLAFPMACNCSRSGPPV
jgi:hypothetical protein